MAYRYQTNRKIAEANYKGLKADQARALFLIAEAGAEGLTDDDLAKLNVNGEVKQEGEKGLKVKLALLGTGFIIRNSIPTERKGSERAYEFTGTAIPAGKSATVQMVAAAVEAQKSGSKSDFARKLLEQQTAAGNEAVADEDKALKVVSGVWMRLQDMGILRQVRKADLAAAAASAAPSETGTADEGEEEDGTENE